MEFGILLKLSATCYKQKQEILLIARPPTCWKCDSCIWFLGKDKKDIKTNL